MTTALNQRLRMFRFLTLIFVLVSYANSVRAEGDAWEWIVCEGDYSHHLQGVARDDAGQLFWSFTTMIVKTTAEGALITQVEAPNHHGDLAYEDGRLYVAVNLGKFNELAGQADSWIYVYDAEDLTLLAKHPVPEVVHGAGGMDLKDGRYFVVGGLPNGWIENYVYEYDADFRFVERHEIASGWTQLGIQTAAWHDGRWWFGCYGEIKTMLTTDETFRLTGHFAFNCSLGVVGVSKGRLLIADGPRTGDGRFRGRVRLVQPDPMKGLVAAP